MAQTGYWLVLVGPTPETEKLILRTPDRTVAGWKAEEFIGVGTPARVVAEYHDDTPPPSEWNANWPPFQF